MFRNYLNRQLHMCPEMETSDKTDGAIVCHSFYVLMLDAYGIEYKSYSPVFHRIPLS